MKHRTVIFKIEKENLIYKLRVNGIKLKRKFITQNEAKNYINVLSQYWSDKAQFIELTK